MTREYEYSADTYWLLGAFWMGRKSVVEHINTSYAIEHEKECKRRILKYKTKALISEDRGHYK